MGGGVGDYVIVGITKSLNELRESTEHQVVQSGQLLINQQNRMSKVLD